MQYCSYNNRYCYSDGWRRGPGGERICANHGPAPAVPAPRAIGAWPGRRTRMLAPRVKIAYNAGVLGQDCPGMDSGVPDKHYVAWRGEATVPWYRDVSIIDFLKPLGKHTVLIALIVLVVVAGTLIGAARSVDNTPYEATAQLLLNPVSRVNLEGSGSTGSTVTDPSRIVRSAATLMMSLDVANRVHDAAAKSDNAAIRALSAVEPVDLRGMITVENSQDLLVVKSHADNADVATWLANTWARRAWPPSTRSMLRLPVRTWIRRWRKPHRSGRRPKTSTGCLANNPISGLQQELTQANAFVDAATDSKNEECLRAL